MTESSEVIRANWQWDTHRTSAFAVELLEVAHDNS